jgi:hypothetical protein
LDDDACWQTVNWASASYSWDGSGAADPDDYNGKFKIVWTPEKLFLLVVISDDILRDDHDIPVDTYWEDDGLDIFIDEDHINETHECGSFAFNAFAYHIAAYPRTPLGAKTIFSDTLATYNVVDLGLSCSPTHSLVFNDHALVKVFRSGTVYTWEIALDVYDNSYADDGINHPVVLQPGKFLGLAVAYADNDNGTREGYYGSEENYNDNATDKPMSKYTDHFGKVELVEEFHTDLKNSDTDGDGFKDGAEVAAGYNPLSKECLKLPKRIEINTGQKHELSYFLGGVKLGSFPISAGLPRTPTPKGHFKIENKALKAWSPYGLWMPYWMALVPTGRFGIHELPVWPSGYREGEDHLGRPASHGCVRVGQGTAEFLYNWAEIGTPVFIY